MAQGIPDYMVFSPKTYALQTSQLVVSNSVAETSIFSCTIKGGDLAKYSFFRGRINYSYLNNTGVNRTWRVKFKYGSTVMYNDITSGMGSGAGVRAGWIDFHISVQGGNQFLGGLIEQSFRNTATSGIGDLQITAGHTETSFAGTASEAASGDLTFDITVELSFASVLHTWTREFGFLEYGSEPSP